MSLVDEPEHVVRSRPPDPNWNHHWIIRNVEYAAETILKNELKITNKQWREIIIKNYKEKLGLRSESMENNYSGKHFCVYAIDDVKEILKLIKTVT